MLVFTVSTIDTDGCCGVVHLAGDLTRTQVSLLKQELSANFETPDHMIIDVSELVFVDWNGPGDFFTPGCWTRAGLLLLSPPPDVLKLLGHPDWSGVSRSSTGADATVHSRRTPAVA